MLNLMMSKNNLSNNNLSNNVFYSNENHSLQNSPTNNNTSQPVTVDKSVWDMYQLLMQNATTQSCQQNESTSSSTLDQLLLAATSKLSSPQHQQLQQQHSVSPILVVINNNSHNTSLNHPNSMMITNHPLVNNNQTTTTSACTITPNNHQFGMSANNHFDSQQEQQQFNMNNCQVNFNDVVVLQQQQQPKQQQQQHVMVVDGNDNKRVNHDSKHVNSPSMIMVRGIQKSHKMAKLTQHVASSIHSSPTTSELNSSSCSSSTPMTPLSNSFNNNGGTSTTTTTASGVKSEGKFSRPLLKNETVLCEKPKFKQNYFVFEKKKEKTPISFHNISVNEIISGEIQQVSNTNSNVAPSNSPKHANKKKQKVSNNNNGKQQQFVQPFIQQPIQVFQQHVSSQSMQSLDSSTSPKMMNIPQLQKQQLQTTQQFATQPNIRMTHSPNTSNSSNNSNGQLNQQPITHQLLAQQQVLIPQTPLIENNSSVLNILLSNQQQQQQQQIVGNVSLQQELSFLNNHQHDYTPINSFSTTTTTSNNNNNNLIMMTQGNNQVDNLLASLSPVVESLFPQQQRLTNEAANNANFMNSEALPSSSLSFLPGDDFIVEEDLSNFVFDNSSATTATISNNSSHVEANPTFQDLSQEQWSDLLEQYINMMNKNN